MLVVCSILLASGADVSNVVCEVTRGSKSELMVVAILTVFVKKEVAVAGATVNAMLAVLVAGVLISAITLEFEEQKSEDRTRLWWG